MAQTQEIDRPREQSAIEIFRNRLQTRRSELVDALKGSGIDADRFIRTALSAAQNSPDLISDCSFSSLWTELLKACRDRLLPDGRQGIIVPYKGKAKWQPMYRGLLDRFEQSGEYKWVTANIHRDDDIEWDVWIDETGQHFIHRPGPGAGRVIDTYACATTKSGGFFLTVVNEQDMSHIRSVSRAKNEESPWQNWPDQMRLKSALKRLCKLLPMPQPLEDLVRHDDDDFDEMPAPSLAPKPPRPRGAANALQHFAGDPTGAGEDAPITESKTESMTEPKTTEPEQQTAPATPQVNIDTAYERGAQAKRQGFKRTAIPPEYREAARGREAVAWRRGFDGDPPPQDDNDGAADAGH
jgi:recombination protein RecT